MICKHLQSRPDCFHSLMDGEVIAQIVEAGTASPEERREEHSGQQGSRHENPRRCTALPQSEEQEDCKQSHEASARSRDKYCRNENRENHPYQRPEEPAHVPAEKQCKRNKNNQAVGGVIRIGERADPCSAVSLDEVSVGIVSKRSQGRNDAGS